ncbi:MAG: regulatory protein ArsR [Phycisphaerales bacterium]|nr:regulatory protein ArsR [Phycisphaerales bacterium]
MNFDPIIANPGRLTILTALLSEATQDFVTLRGNTRLTDGNLTTHARKLASAGLVAIEKTARAGRPVTTITLTEDGRAAFERHVDTLVNSVRRPAILDSSLDAALSAPLDPMPAAAAAVEEDTWID